MKKDDLNKVCLEIVNNFFLNCDSFSQLLLKESVEKNLSRYQDKLAIATEDIINEILDEFKKRIALIFAEACDIWKVGAVDKRMLFPQGCRFLFTKGNNTVVVVEQKPQVRRLKLLEWIVNYKDSVDFIEFQLSLPYQIFIFDFNGYDFNSLYLGWTNKPLSSLNDVLFCPVLPNIRRDLSVCLGTSIEYNESIDFQVQNILNHFWDSKFNDHLNELWKDRYSGDERLIDVYNWQQLSLKDPTFILEVKFNTSKKTLKNIIDKIAINKNVNLGELKKKLSDVLDKSTNELSVSLKKYFKDTNFNKYFPKEIKQDLNKILCECMEGLQNILLAVLSEVENNYVPTAKMQDSLFMSSYNKFRTK